MQLSVQSLAQGCLETRPLAFFNLWQKMKNWPAFHSMYGSGLIRPGDRTRDVSR
jgi:hypothetical protein